MRGLERGQLLLVRLQRVSVTRRRPQRALSDVEHIVGARTEGEQAFGPLAQGRCLGPTREKTEGPY